MEEEALATAARLNNGGLFSTFSGSSSSSASRPIIPLLQMTTTKPVATPADLDLCFDQSK